MDGNTLIRRRFSDPPRCKQNCKLLRQETTTSASNNCGTNNSKAKYNILCLDGGGIRGIIECAILEELENATGKYIHELFDFVCGVSTGAILGTGIGYHGKASHAKEMYTQLGPTVFGRKKLLKVISKEGKGMYNSQKLRKELVEEFGEYQMYCPTECNDPNLKVCIVASEFCANKRYRSVYFRNYHAPYPDRGSEFKTVSFVDALMASTAAPLYLDAHTIDGAVFFDGGMVCNNPTLEAIMEAKQIYGKDKQFTLVSLGTGTAEDTSEATDFNLMKEFTSFFGKFGGTSSDSTDGRARSSSGSPLPKKKWFTSILRDEDNDGIPDSPLLDSINKLIAAVGNSESVCDDVERYIRSSCADGQVDYFRFSPTGLGNYDLATSDKKTIDLMYTQAKAYIQQNREQFNNMVRSILKSTTLSSPSPPVESAVQSAPPPYSAAVTMPPSNIVQQHPTNYVQPSYNIQAFATPIQ